MKEHNFSLETLIGGWYMPEKICDDLITYYEDKGITTKINAVGNVDDIYTEISKEFIN